MNYFVLNNIRSSWNVGAIMRTADALAMGVILVGYTPKPVGKTLAMIKKTAIGAENSVPWEHFENFQLVLRAYPQPDFTHLGIELDPSSHDMFQYLKSFDQSPEKSTKSVLLWLGNEISGLEKDLMSNLTAVVHLQMQGQKESLNVSNCACAVGYLLYYSQNS